MHKIIHATTLAALAAAISLGSGPAQAGTDTKGISGNQCRPLTATDATGLVFDTRGAVNSTTVNKRVICGLLNDAEDNYTPTDHAFLYQYIKAGSIDGNVNCTYYIGPVDFPAFVGVTYTANVSVTAGSYNFGGVNVTTNPSNGWDNVGATAVCTLTGKTTLAFLRVYEYGITNSP